MSRVGKLPIPLPDGVTVQIHADHLVVKGGGGELTTPVPEGISFDLDDGTLVASRADEAKQTRAYHGLARALAANAIIGVSEGFRKELEIHGIGYRGQAQGRKLTLQLGFSHPVTFVVPEGIELQAESQTKFSISGIDKQLVGETAARIRRIRPPDAYKGKGVRYSDEVVRTKVGKSIVAAQ